MSLKMSKIRLTKLQSRLLDEIHWIAFNGSAIEFDKLTKDLNWKPSVTKSRLKTVTKKLYELSQ